MMVWQPSFYRQRIFFRKVVFLLYGVTMPIYRKLVLKTTESLTVNEMPDDFHRFLWLMLPLIVCREGRGLDNSAWVKAKAMPLRLDVTPDDVQIAMDWYAAHGIITRYKVNGYRYFYLTNWSKYQGNTDKEAESIYPEPTEESIQNYSRATPELLQTNSVPMQYNAIQNNTNAELPTGEKASPDGGQSKNKVREALEIKFSTVTGLQRPKTSTQSQRKSAGSLWWNPLREIAELCEWDTARAIKLIDASVDKLKGGGLTVSSPKSILNTARALVADGGAGGHLQLF